METQFTSGLNNKTYHTRSWDDLSCTFSNVVCDVECSLCGLKNVGETKRHLLNRMSGHRYEINHGSNLKPARSFFLSFKVRILEKYILPY